MTALPARDRLGQVIASLAEHLPGQLEVLLEAERFSDGRVALARLADRSARDRALDRIAPDEARRAAELLLLRWSRIAEVRLEAAVAIVGPDEVWVDAQGRTVTLRIATADVDECSSVEWSGASSTGMAGEARLDLPPGSRAPATVRVSARVFAKVRGKRVVLVATRRIQVRRARVTLHPEEELLRVQEVDGASTAGMTVQVDGQAHVTDGQGRVFVQPFPSEPVVFVGDPPD